MDNCITVFEYGYLADTAGKNDSTRINWISTEAYAYLKQLCLCSEAESSFIRLKMIDSTEVLQTQNYAGVILTPDGTQIEILPKIGRGSCVQRQTQAREALLCMLASLGEFRHISTETANITQQRMPLLEVFISQFLSSVNHLVKRGIRSGYTQREDNLFYLKGKLQVGKQLRHNLVNRHRFFVEYDEYLPDRPENRLIHSALSCIKPLCRTLANQRLQQELSFAFDEVPQCRDHQLDAKSVKLDRGMAHYQQPLAWAELILNGFSPLTMKGRNSATSLLFPMEAVFESYVAAQLPKQLNAGYQLKTQVQSSYLVKHANQNWFQLKPDLLILKGNRHLCVLDTKWKMLDSSKLNGTDKYGLSQADIYQMFAYGHNYLAGSGDIYLIYPAHANFKSPIEESFKYTDSSGKPTALKLWIVPYKIDKKGGKLLLPQASNTGASSPFKPQLFVAS